MTNRARPRALTRERYHRRRVVGAADSKLSLAVVIVVSAPVGRDLHSKQIDALVVSG